MEWVIDLANLYANFNITLHDVPSFFFESSTDWLNLQWNNTLTMDN